MGNYERFFIYTNPLFWVFACVVLLSEVTDKGFRYVGLNNWWFIVFKLNKNIHKKSFRKNCLNFKTTIKYKELFWINKKAWDYIFKRIDNYE